MLRDVTNPHDKFFCQALSHPGGRAANYMRATARIGLARSRWSLELYGEIFQAVGFARVESCPTQAVLPLVGLGGQSHPRPV
ncbi:MAG: hypothetical protein ACQESR_28220 [Planctomycetota bacterium]